MSKGLRYSIYKNDSLPEDSQYIAKSYPAGTYGTEKFINRMVAKGTYNRAQYHGFITELIETFEDVLTEGNSINFADTIKITPVVKGKFDDHKDGFKKGRNFVDIKSSITKRFIKKIQDKVLVRKKTISSPSAVLRRVDNVKTEENELCHHFLNKVSGKFLKFKDHRFAGIELRNCRVLEESIYIEVDNLNIAEFTQSSFYFSILYNMEMPAWLTDGMDIFITLLYESTADPGSKHYTLPYRTMELKTRWKEL